MGKTLNSGRNYSLDLLRCIAGFFMATFHWIWRVYFPAQIDNGYWGAYIFTQTHSIEGWSWFKGTYTMGFFVFVTGFFLMDHFKKQQAKGAFENKKGHLGEIWRYSAKSWVSMAPMMLVGTGLGWFLNNFKAQSPLKTWFNTFVWNIWQFLGVSGFGMFYQLPAGTQVDVTTRYNAVLWYIAAFIVGCGIFYALLIASEKITVWVVCPLMFMLLNVWADVWLLDTGAQSQFGITTLLPRDFCRFWGVACFGVWGWYAVDYLRKKAPVGSKAAKKVMVVLLVFLAYALITSWTGYFGGMLNQDVVWMVIAALVIANIDPFTRGINTGLQKFPLSQYMGEFSAGLYLCHYPILANYWQEIIDAVGLQSAGWVYILILVGASIVYVILNRLVLKPVYRKIGEMIGAYDKPAPALTAAQNG